MKFLQFQLLFLLLVISVFSVNGDGITSIAKTNSLLKKADEAFKSKDYRTAIRSYEDALRERSDLPPQTQLNLGNAYFLSKQFEKAQKNYLAASAATASPAIKSIAYQQIGNIFSESKDYKVAMDWYKKSLKSNPENTGARFNYELAYKLNQKAEEEKKQNQQQNPEKDKQDQKKQDKQEQQKQDQQKGGNGKEGKDKENEKGKDQPGQDKKEQQKKGGKDGQDQNKPGNQGDETVDKDKPNKDGKNNADEQEAKDGKEKSAKKGQESDELDPNAVRVDKKKLMETGLSEEQAKSLLQAMRQSEVKYLQQRRFGSKKGGSSGRVRW